MKDLFPKVAFVFPGVGSQHTLMAKTFYDHSEIARATFEEASDILKLNLHDICFARDFASKLNEIEVSQVALFTASMAIYRVFEQEIGLVGDYYMGHSLGECSALCASGMLDFVDALEIIQKRGYIIKEVSSTLDGIMMWVINVEHQTVAEVCKEYTDESARVSVSAFDSSTQYSISGHRRAVMRAAEALERRGALVYPLKMSGPFHCQLMVEASRRFKKVLQEYHFKEPERQVIANYTALPYREAKDVIHNLSRQLMSPIRWQESIQFVWMGGVKIAIESGPKDVLTFLMKKNAPDIRCFAFNHYNLIGNVQQECILQREQFLSVIGRCLRIAVSTRNYNNDYDAYREKVVLPYKEVEEIFQELTARSQEPDKEQLEKAITMVKSVLDNKRIPEEVKMKKVEQLFEGKTLKL